MYNLHHIIQLPSTFSAQMERWLKDILLIILWTLLLNPDGSPTTNLISATSLRHILTLQSQLIWLLKLFQKSWTSILQALKFQSQENSWDSKVTMLPNSPQMAKAFNFIFLLPFQLEVRLLLRVSLMLYHLLVNYTVQMVLFSVTLELQRLVPSLLIASRQLWILLLINWQPNLLILSTLILQLLILT